MGLFRRGTKLLKLGSGLRDCCCRPENPEECWCPGLCAYYITIDGETTEQYTGCPELSGIFYTNPVSCLNNNCTDYGGATTDPSVAADQYYLGDLGHPNQPFDTPGVFGGIRLLQRFGTVYSNSPNDGKFVSVSALAIVGIRCRFGGDSQTPVWQIYCELAISEVEDVVEELEGFLAPIRTTTRVSEYIKSFVPITDRGNLDADLPALNSEFFEECASGDKQTCLAADDPVRHLKDLAVVVSPENVQVSSGDISQTFSWPHSTGIESVCRFVDRQPFGSGAVVDSGLCEDQTPLEMTADESLTTATFQIKKKPFCAAGPCDCTESLTGMTVTFEGKTFTYGSLEQFVDGSDTWEETIPGLFRRTTRETCDGTYVAAVKIAEVFCETVDGTDYWTVYLDSECYERDEATCPASADARRIMQWTGVFTCGEDGKPGGTPHSATDAADPPDLDSNTTLGTPAAECAGDLDLPAISFG